MSTLETGRRLSDQEQGDLVPEYFILLVEDEADGLAQIQEPLEAYEEAHPHIRFALSHTDHAGMAVDLIRRERFDLVVLDLRIRPYDTNRDGIRVLEEAERRGIPIIVVSITLTDDDIERYRKNRPLVRAGFMRGKSHHGNEFGRDAYLKAVLGTLLIDEQPIVT